MSKKSIAFIETPYAALCLFAFIKQNNIRNDSITIIAKNDPLIHSVFENFSFPISYEPSNQKINFFIKEIFLSIFSKKDQLIISSFLGAKNKLIALLIRSKAYIYLDDGLACLMYRKLSIKSLELALRVVNFADVDITFFSTYPKVFKSQKGIFNVELQKYFAGDVKRNSRLFSNKCFYICSYPIFDGLSIDEEEKLIYFLKSFAKERKQQLIILPHRRDLNKKDKDYKFYSNILITNVPFELFYLSNHFKNSSFVTLYSSAINIVENSHERFFIPEVFTPSIGKTFFQKIFGRYLTDKEILIKVFNHFKERGIQKLKYN